MSTLQVANIHLESTGNNRIQVTSSNTVSIVAGGSNTLSVNSTAVNTNGQFTVNGAPLQGAALLFGIYNQTATPSNVQTFDTSGTWTKPGGGTLVLIECIGAGGSGSRHSTAANTCGGVGGAYQSVYVNIETLPSTVSVTVGTGGASRTGSNQTGAAGGNSSFGSYITATGGPGGAFAGNIFGVQPPSPVTRTTTQSWPDPLSTIDVDDTGNTQSRINWIYAELGFVATNSAGGASVRAGAAGGAAPSLAGGTSTYSGNGGAGGVTGGNGFAPGGGGGGGTSTSGAGANGRVRITVW